MINQKVAVIMPIYNGGNTMSRAIESVFNQTHKNWHLYIINDCSTDNTKELLDRYQEIKNISIINNEVNEGVARSRNKGIKAAFEDVICFLDSDDEWSPKKLEQQLSAVNDSNKLICTSYSYIKNDIARKVDIKDSFISRSDFLAKKFRVCFSSVMIRTNGRKIYFKEIGHEDFLYLYEWLGIYKDIHIIHDALVNYFVTESSLSSSKLKTIKWQFAILKNIFPRAIHSQIYYMILYIYRGISFQRNFNK